MSGSSVDSGGDEVGNGSSRHHDLDGFFPCLGDRESQIWTIENATENRGGGVDQSRTSGIVNSLKSSKNYNGWFK